MSSAQQFCVRWNSYHTNLQTIFPKLLSTENFADVTLACENRQLKCHKVVLSACSAYFERLLVQNPCKHPIIFMKDMRFREMQSLVDFMYKGEVNVTQDDLPSLLKSAEALQIRGLCGSDANTLNPTGGDQKDYVKPKNGEAFSTEKVTHAQHQHSNAPSKKRKSYEDDAVGERNSSGQHHQSAADAVKEETVEEDGLYYGEMEDGENYDDQDDDSGKPGSSLVQPSDFPIANVQCEYDDATDDSVTSDVAVTRLDRDTTVTRSDHDYNSIPAFIIKQIPYPTLELRPTTRLNNRVEEDALEIGQKLLTATSVNSTPMLNVLNVAQRAGDTTQHEAAHDCSGYRRVRRSEELLREAAECVRQGHTFQVVSDKYDIPISTIRFFMARKGILPKRRRGRTGLPTVQWSPEMQSNDISCVRQSQMILRSSSDENQ